MGMCQPESSNRRFLGARTVHCDEHTALLNRVEGQRFGERGDIEDGKGAERRREVVGLAVVRDSDRALEDDLQTVHRDEIHFFPVGLNSARSLTRMVHFVGERDQRLVLADCEWGLVLSGMGGSGGDSDLVRGCDISVGDDLLSLAMHLHAIGGTEACRNMLTAIRILDGAIADRDFWPSTTGYH